MDNETDAGAHGAHSVIAMIDKFDNETQTSPMEKPKGRKRSVSPLLEIPQTFDKPKSKARSTTNQELPTAHDSGSLNSELVLKEVLETQKSLTALIGHIVPMLERPGSKSNVLKFIQEARLRNIIFSGHNDPKSFFDSFENLLELLPLTDIDVKRSLRDLLSGPALDWFQVHESNLHSWLDVKIGLKRNYAPLNADLKLKQLMFTLKQQPDEKVMHFISKMRKFNSELQRPLSDLELVDLVKANLHPDFVVHVQMSNILEIDILEDVCVKFEQALQLKVENKHDIKRIVPDKSINAINLCYKCHSPEHFIKDCPLHKKDKSSGDKTSEPSLKEEVLALKCLVQKLTSKIEEMEGKNA